MVRPKFTVYRDNNPLNYVKNSRLDASLIWWLSNLSLFNFSIWYQFGKTYKATDVKQMSSEPQIDIPLFFREQAQLLVC